MNTVFPTVARRSLTAATILLAASCTSTRTYQSNTRGAAANLANAQDAECPSGIPPYNPTAAQVERDEIFMLLAYAVVGKNWQTKEDSSRGYNIGSVLVDSDNNIVCWARNSVNVTRNKTQHGEVRLMTNYLSNVPNTSLPKYKLYTTLEPCAMCSGMMTLQSLYLTVYGQTDPHYGDAIQRLELNSLSCGGYAPYPRAVVSIPSTLGQRIMLDEEYPPKSSITAWLTTEDAKLIYDGALVAFMQYQVSFPENSQVLESAKDFLTAVPANYAAIPYTDSCPSW